MAKNSPGRCPKILSDLTAGEIQDAGVAGYDAETFLQSKGATADEIIKIQTYEKWIINYNIGFATYKLLLTDKANEAWKNGEKEILKEAIKTKLNWKQEEGGSGIKVTITGLDEHMKPKRNSGRKGVKKK